MVNPEMATVTLPISNTRDALFPLIARLEAAVARLESVLEKQSAQIQAVSASVQIAKASQRLAAHDR